jgi:hypothetical protein
MVINKILLKRYIIVSICIVLLSLISFGMYTFYKYGMVKKIEDSPLLEQTKTTLEKGITIEDDQNDFAHMGDKGKTNEKPNNPNSYKYTFFDIKSVSFGIDDKYLYCKIQFRDIIPSRTTTIENDYIEAGGVKVNILDSKGEDLAILALQYGYIPIFNIKTIASKYYYGPTGIREPEEKRFAYTEVNDKIYGGPESDYLLGIFSLEKINLSKGSIIQTNVSFEAESKIYDHASVDVLGGTGKMPAVITWDTNSNIFNVNNNFYNN